jgi:hypothetical protein
MADTGPKMRKLIYYTLAIVIYFLSPLIVCLAIITGIGEDRSRGWLWKR